MSLVRIGISREEWDHSGMQICVGPEADPRSQKPGVFISVKGKSENVLLFSHFNALNVAYEISKMIPRIEKDPSIVLEIPNSNKKGVIILNAIREDNKQMLRLRFIKASPLRGVRTVTLIMPPDSMMSFCNEIESATNGTMIVDVAQSENPPPVAREPEEEGVV